VHNAIRFCSINNLIDRPGSDPKAVIRRIRCLMLFAIHLFATISQLIALTIYHRCTDRRDRIFALLGLCWNAGDGYSREEEPKRPKDFQLLRVDYTLTLRQVFTRAFRQICFTSKQLNILIYIRYNPISSSDSTPSWANCPNLDFGAKIPRGNFLVDSLSLLWIESNS
jgi:hypothetical protein